MRLLHTSDWHLGRETYGVSRRTDHEAVIDELVAVATTTRPHLIIHSGDLFDGPRPAYQDLALGVEAMQRLGAIAPVVVVCGNHDAPPLFRLFTQLMGRDPRIRFVDVARLPEDGGVIECAGDEGERIRLVALPFIHANRLVTGFEDPTLRTAVYADRVAAIERRLTQDLIDTYNPGTDILLFAAHLYVGGATYGRSERALHVSEAYASRPEALPAVTYAALGHIHKPQAIPGGGAGRYAGSPIQLDFGEEGEDKTFVVVSAQPGRPAAIEARPIDAGRRLLRLAGTLDDLKGSAELASGKLVHVTVRSAEIVPGVADEVEARLPGATILEVVEEIASRRLEVVIESNVDPGSEPTMAELFETYVSEVGTRSASSRAVVAAFNAVMEAVEDEEPIRLKGSEAFLGDRGTK